MRREKRQQSENLRRKERGIKRYKVKGFILLSQKGRLHLAVLALSVTRYYGGTPFNITKRIIKNADSAQ